MDPEINKILNAIDEANLIEKQNDIEKFKILIGDKCLFEINKNVHESLQNIKNIKKINNGTYLLKVNINELNIKNIRKNRNEFYYFRFNKKYNYGIPHEIIKECIKLPDDLSIIKVDTHNMADMYFNTFADICCTFSGFISNLLCCCIPFCCIKGNTKTLKPNHIDMTLFIWFKKKDLAMGLPISSEIK